MSESPRHRLRDDVRVEVAYDDATPFGSVLGGIERTLRRACQLIVEHRERHGMADVVACSQPLLASVFAGELGGLFENGKLRPDCLYPPSELVTPAALNIIREGSRPTQVSLDREAFAELACWMGDFYRGRAQPDSGA